MPKSQENVPEEKLVFNQTEGGMYGSFPDLKDVLDELGIEENEEDWRQEAGDRGHGEYVTNVERAAMFARDHGLKTKAEIERMLSEAELETN